MLPMAVTIRWTLGDRLRKARETAGLSQAEIAEALGVQGGSVSRFEHDHQALRRSYLLAWAMATGVDLDWLRYGDQDFDGDPGGASTPTKWYARALVAA
jgi:transcriptional regulator with XRE-family HTH domain